MRATRRMQGRDRDCRRPGCLVVVQEHVCASHRKESRATAGCPLTSLAAHSRHAGAPEPEAQGLLRRGSGLRDAHCGWPSVRRLMGRARYARGREKNVEGQPERRVAAAPRYAAWKPLLTAGLIKARSIFS